MHLAFPIESIDAGGILYEQFNYIARSDPCESLAGAIIISLIYGEKIY